MEEMIDSELVKKLRSERSWSQEHLSLVSGLSLRTVQRIESRGNCSADSKKAIASAFDIDVMLLTAGNSVVLSSNDCRLVAALSWLSLIDSGEYESSWKEAGDQFHSRVDCADWIERLKAVREPLGRNVIRNIKKSTERDTLPGVPDGDYVILVFDAAYDKKRQSEEKVTLEKSKQEWRVVGYFIQ